MSLHFEERAIVAQGVASLGAFADATPRVEARTCLYDKQDIASI